MINVTTQFQQNNYIIGIVTQREIQILTTKIYTTVFINMLQCLLFGFW